LPLGVPLAPGAEGFAGNGWKDVRNITGGFVAMTAVGGFEIEE